MRSKREKYQTPLDQPLTHWSGYKTTFSKRHECEEQHKEEYELCGDEILFDSKAGQWEMVGEYMQPIAFCPFCGWPLERLEKPGGNA